MFRNTLPGLALIFAALFFAAFSHAESIPEKSIPAESIAEKTAGMHHIDGYFPLDYDAKAGKLYLTVDKLNTDFIWSDHDLRPAGPPWNPPRRCGGQRAPQWVSCPISTSSCWSNVT